MRSAVIASLGGFLFCFDTAVISDAEATLSEIFPNKVRAWEQALGSFTHWFKPAAISWSFPVFAAISGGFIFTFYAFCMVLQLLWVLFIMPETKGIPLEELQKKWAYKKYQL